ASGLEAAGATIVPAMTPAYASPEQLRGDAISTASDIYSLGILLHELVTGVHPVARGTGDRAIQNRAGGERGNAPGTGSADLDAIVAMATRAAPRDRYASAQALSAD